MSIVKLDYIFIDTNYNISIDKLDNTKYNTYVFEGVDVSICNALRRITLTEIPGTFLEGKVLLNATQYDTNVLNKTRFNYIPIKKKFIDYLVDINFSSSTYIDDIKSAYEERKNELINHEKLEKNSTDYASFDYAICNENNSKIPLVNDTLNIKFIYPYHIREIDNVFNSNIDLCEEEYKTMQLLTLNPNESILVYFRLMNDIAKNHSSALVGNCIYKNEDNKYYLTFESYGCYTPSELCVLAFNELIFKVVNIIDYINKLIDEKYKNNYSTEIDIHVIGESHTMSNILHYSIIKYIINKTSIELKDIIICCSVHRLNTPEFQLKINYQDNINLENHLDLKIIINNSLLDTITEILNLKKMIM